MRREEEVSASTDLLLSLIERPATYIAADRLAECFGGMISPAACRLMLEQPRLASRLSTIICSHYGMSAAFPTEQIDEIDLGIARLTIGELTHLVMQAGAICWANTFATIIEGSSAREIQNSISDHLFLFGVRNRDLGCPARPIGEPESLRHRIELDGMLCLAGWISTIPTAVSLIVRLKFPPSAILDDEPRAVSREFSRRVIYRAYERRHD